MKVTKVCCVVPTQAGKIGLADILALLQTGQNDSLKNETVHTMQQPVLCLDQKRWSQTC